MKRNKRKIRFWDMTFLVVLASLILMFTSIPYLGDNSIILWVFIIATICAVISVGLLTWGMIVYECKRKDWGWLIATIILFFVGGAGLFVSVVYYFVVLRRALKKNTSL